MYVNVVATIFISLATITSSTPLAIGAVKNIGGIAQPKIGGPIQLNAKVFGNRLTDAEVRLIQDNCNNDSNSCKGQSEKAKRKRQKIKDGLLDNVKNSNPGLSYADAEKVVEKRLSNIQSIKKKLNVLNLLVDIEPADDGTYQGDMLLNNEQSATLLKLLDSPGDIPDPNFSNDRVKRAAATYFEKWPTYRWTSPIRYWISPSFSSAESATIDAALNTLSSSIGCIKFAKDTTRLKSGSQIQYLKSGSSDCSGVSEIGYQGGINHVQLDVTNWCKGDLLKGLVTHETIHSLGGGHEQSRPDRDKYVTILWNNIDPQEFAQYSKDDYATTYGATYDYMSVMHYEQGTFAKTEGLQTMSPKTSSSLSGNSLTSNDVLQLKRMYCKSSSCMDKDVNCGFWASVKNYCKTTYSSTMKTNCPKSCGYC